jgi:hypothetical protein
MFDLESFEYFKIQLEFGLLPKRKVVPLKLSTPWKNLEIFGHWEVYV